VGRARTIPFVAAPEPSLQKKKKKTTWGFSSWLLEGRHSSALVSVGGFKGGQFLHVVVGFSRAGKFWHLVEEQAGCRHDSQN
jgi:hypothetical protein